ncbi:MAG: glycosyl transferase family 1 [Alteromonas sp.]|nr:MAG: glycosyl transferase family 1 [Alteromonas sp.]
MKKTLLLTENFPPINGGSGRWFWELYSRLPTDKVFIATHNVEGSESFDKLHNLNIIRLSLVSREWGLRSSLGLKFYWKSFWAIRKLIKKHDIEEIHCGRVIHEGVTAWLLHMFSGISYRCFIHGEDVETAATSREQSWLVRQVCKNAINLICNSHNSASLVQSLGFSSLDKCDVLHPGVDTERFKPSPVDNTFRAKMGWERKFVLLTVGRLQMRKGQDMLIKALPQLLENNENLHYAIVGKGEALEELKTLVSDNNLSENVDILTDADDNLMTKCYQQCDLFVLPNRTIGNDIEGFGMVLLEAQACGKFVVAGDSGGTKEALLEGKTGFIINCSSVSNVAIGLAKSINEVHSRILDPTAIHEDIHMKFGWGHHVSKFKRIIG